MSIVATVVWLLCAMTTTICAVVALLVWVFARNRADNEIAMLFVRVLHFSAIVTGALLTFARAVGEFGSTILVSGNLVGRTQTAPLYIFSKFNEGQIVSANAIAIVLALLSFLIFSFLFFARQWIEVDEISR